MTSRGARYVAVEAAVLVFFVAFVVLTHAPFVKHSTSWQDASWYFHFGRKLLNDGAVPYRDYVFQVGPLPIYVDALFQKILGQTYTSSAWAAVIVRALRAFVLYLIARRFVGRPTAILFGIFPTFDSYFSVDYHWSIPYSSLFGTLATLFFVCAWQVPRRRRLYLGLAGLSVALIFSARQSQGLLVTAMTAGCVVVLAWTQRRFMDLRGAASVAGGFAAGAGAIALVLAAQSALGPAIQQLFIDAPQKKGVHGLDSLLDVVSGGGLVLYKDDPRFTMLTGYLLFNALPLIFVGAVIWGLRRAPRISARGVWVAVIPFLVYATALSHVMQLNPPYDLVHIFGWAVLLLALFVPRRAEAWFGIDAPALVALASVPVANHVALEMSNPGRGWGDGPSLSLLAMFVGLASRHIPQRAKLVACAVLAPISGMNSWMSAQMGVNPFAKEDFFDGSLAEQHFTISAPAASGLLVTESKFRAVEWMRENVKPGDTCFVYGNAALLYDMLECRNPTRLDVTIPDFLTARDADEAVVVLKRKPPRWIVAAETHWMNPDLDTPPNDYLYAGMNEAASRALHLGLRGLLDDYVPVGETSTAVGPGLLVEAQRMRDTPHRYRLYRLRDAASP